MALLDSDTDREVARTPSALVLDEDYDDPRARLQARLAQFPPRQILIQCPSAGPSPTSPSLKPSSQDTPCFVYHHQEPVFPTDDSVTVPLIGKT